MKTEIYLTPDGHLPNGNWQKHELVRYLPETSVVFDTEEMAIVLDNAMDEWAWCATQLNIDLSTNSHWKKAQETLSQINQGEYKQKMEDWIISVKHWGNGYCELKAETKGKLPIYGTSIDEVFKKVKEAVEQ